MTKRQRLCALVLGASIAQLSHAEGNMTLYGLIDTGVTWSNHQKGGDTVEMTSGKLSGARWGIRGSEVLGNGWRAEAVLENGYNSASGATLQSGRMFGRQSTVGLSNVRYGTLRLGRQYTPLALYGGPLTAALRWGTSLMVHPLDLDLLGGTTRFNNAIDYESPDFGGWRYRVQYALSNQAGAGFANNREWGGAIRYRSEHTTFVAGYAQLARPDSATNANGATTGDYQSALPLWIRQVDATLAGTPASSAMLAVGTQRTGMAAIVQTIERWSVGTTLSRTLLSQNVVTGAHTSGLNGTGSLSLDVAEANLTFRATPLNHTGVMVTYSSGRLQSGGQRASPHWWQFGIGNDYFLSKRTDVYVAAAYIMGSARDAIAQITLGSPASGRTEAGVSIGMRHRF
ncbi:porin [Chitinasiproducens palmae]|uniref:Porin, GBP family n=1 Tax=Chitinasiproducens palmae TaxID=1770053 RepID=A0A1H2PUB5_9BURK|nr:porin [Chitinasiproducens palmae]SDV50766.1 porin, GBP family [Chitinasiproducens palmae]